jgi:hypothetical protein
MLEETVAMPPDPAPARRLRCRLVPAPVCEPPFDDELPEPPPGRIPGQRELGLVFQLPGGLAAIPEPALDIDPDDEFGPTPTRRDDLPDPRPWAGRFAQAVLEVVAGARPAAQLVRWSSANVYEQVSRSAGRLTDTRRPVLRSVHVCEPVDGVAESAALARVGDRLRVLALRFEGLDGRWQCTAVEFG